MKTSSLTLLKAPETLVLAAGHGGSDTGATFGSFKERDEAVTIVDKIAEHLRTRSVKVVVAPHADDTDVTIGWVNRKFSFGEAWVLDVHRDSASGLSEDDASRRCGVYTGVSSRSIEVGEFLRQAYLRHGANGKSWNRLHTGSRFGGLGWIRQTAPAAHLLELGFMEGKNDPAHLSFLARLAAASLYEAFTGHAFEDGAAPGRPTRTRGGRATRSKAPAVPSAGELLERLAKTYRDLDLEAVFKKVKAEVRPEDISELKETTLAQWILESGWASSKLSREALNFAGLKWRSEMTGYVTKYEYTDWQGETDPYCKFENLENFIAGYWRFLQRDVYRGWTEHTGSTSDFVSFLLKRGYTVSNTYLPNVLKLVPKAAALLA